MRRSRTFASQGLMASLIATACYAGIPEDELSGAFTPLASGTSWTVGVAPGQIGMLQMY